VPAGSCCTTKFVSPVVNEKLRSVVLVRAPAHGPQSTIGVSALPTGIFLIGKLGTQRVPGLGAKPERVTISVGGVDAITASAYVESNSLSLSSDPDTCTLGSSNGTSTDEKFPDKGSIEKTRVEVGVEGVNGPKAMIVVT